MTAAMATALILGLLIGILLGLFGGGGSVLAVPALVYGVGLPLAAAVPTSLLVVGISAATAVLPRLRQVQWRLAAVFGATGAVAAFGGAALNRHLDPSVVLLGFAALIIVAGVRMLQDKGEASGSCALPGGGVKWGSCLPKAGAAGIVVGFLTGLFGVGGGFLIIPALFLLLSLPMASAVATSLVIIVLNSAAGFVAHLGETTIDVGIAATFTIAAIAGSLTAARLGSRQPAARLRRWFAYLVFSVATYVIIQTLTALHA